MAPTQVILGDDPPDRLLIDNQGRSWGLELTSLTFGDVRGDVARARKFGRRLEETLARDSQLYVHLKGRRIVLSKTHITELPRDQDGLLNSIAEDLLVDHGYMRETGVAEGEFVADSPSGTYGGHGPFLVSVRELGIEGHLTVISSAQAEVHKDAVVEHIQDLVARKDSPGNDLLLITAGPPDEGGYLCPPDAVMFHVAARANAESRILVSKPAHIASVVLALWDQPMFIELHRADETPVPWLSSWAG